MLPACRTALLATAFVLVSGIAAAPVDAGIIGTGNDRPPSSAAQGLPGPNASGLRLLKAQMNALKDGLENLEQLKKFFNSDARDVDTIARNAERLIKSLPENENSGEAAWRIAAIASLASQAGTLSALKINDGYQLPDGAVGWDFGASGSAVHRGFTPVTPEASSGDKPVGGQPVSGETALTDGIQAPPRFQSSLPNGMYRIMIVANPDRNEPDGENPFGGRITINGDPIGGSPLADQTQIENRQLGAPGSDKLASAGGNAFRNTALGLGVESWAIVRNGRLEIDFKGLPEGRAISAVIAEPIDLDRLELTPAVADALSTALTGLAPAAGPEARRMGARGHGPVGGSFRGKSGQGGATSPAPAAISAVSFAALQAAGKPKRTATPPRRRAPFIRSFNETRRTQPTLRTTAAPRAVVDAPLTIASAPAPATVAAEDDFFDRQILVKHDGDSADNSDGLAVDLGRLLDDGSDTGTFLCAETPCDAEIFTKISDEPDLSAAAAALGDWLADPDNLVDGWGDVVSVLENWNAGSEVAAVYSFDINVDLWTDVELRANADDGLLVWIDGEFVFGATGPGEFNDAAGYDYHIELPDLEGGSHVIQIISESRGQDSPELRFELRGNPVNNTNQAENTASVPEPAAAALFGLGLAGLAGLRRRIARAKPV